MRKVLMITYYFLPVVYGQSIRVFNFARNLTSYNWFASILTLNHNFFPYLKDFTFSEQIKESKIKVYAVNLFKPFSKIATLNFPNLGKEFLSGASASLLKFFGLSEPEQIWKNRAIKFGEKILKAENFNVIIAFAPPLSNIQIGAHLSKKFKIPLIIDYSLTTALEKHQSKEKKLLRDGSLIIADNRKIKDKLLQNHLFLDYNSVKIIPTGVNFLEFASKHDDKNENFTLTFASGKITVKKIKPILTALNQISRRDELFKKSLVLNLIGIPTRDTINLITKLQLKENVKIFLNLQREAYVKLLCSSNFLIYIDEFDSANIPYDYIGAGKPYIAIINGQNNYRYIIGDYKNSLIADLNDPNSIVNAFAKAFDVFKNQRQISPIVNEENYEINNIIISLVRELENFTYD
jgi:glycosyltransferase involved in cell wall biosynthesis